MVADLRLCYVSIAYHFSVANCPLELLSTGANPIGAMVAIPHLFLNCTIPKNWPASTATNS